MSEKLLDGVELAILFNRFEGIVRKMSNTLYRTGRSGVLNRARDFSCCITSRSLYERANGYNYEAVKIFTPAGSKQPVVVHYVEHCPPDVGAAFIWLKNRDPERWRDVQNVEHVMGKYIISDRPMTAEQWAAERATVINDVVEELPAPEK
jgi:hypothetical protein